MESGTVGVCRARAITLTATERRELKQVAYSHTAGYQQVIRARIVRDAAHGYSNAKIAVRQQVTVDTVRCWRGRYADEGLAGLIDRRRSGRPPLFTPVQIAEVTAIACQLPAETGLPLSRRPGAKTYDQLRRRRRNSPAADTASAGRTNTKQQAATPPAIPSQPLRGTHRRRAVSEPVPPASRAADAVATATPCPPAAAAPAGQAALDPAASTGPGRQTPGAGQGLPSRTRDATKPRSLK
jgi:hypothetical protein